MDKRLPSFCYVFIPDNAAGNYIGMVKQGETGYLRTNFDEKDPELAKQQVVELNSNIGVSEIQVERMSAGALFGWDVLISSEKYLSFNNTHDGYIQSIDRSCVKCKCLQYKSYVAQGDNGDVNEHYCAHNNVLIEGLPKLMPSLETPNWCPVLLSNKPDEPVAHQRFSVDQGWVAVNADDIQHYKNKGQLIRDLIVKV